MLSADDDKSSLSKNILNHKTCQHYL